MRTLAASTLVALAAVPAGLAPAHAQYPVKPVRLIVTFAAGSGTDTVARFIQPQLAAALGQQVVIDNRAGAGGNVGAEVAAKAAADGYTVLMGNSAHSVSMTLYSRPGFDLTRDFTPIILLASGSFTLATHPSIPARSVKELVAFARKRPGEINVATGGATIRLAAKMFESMAGIRMTEVIYKSTPQAITAVISGEASAGFPATSVVIPHVRAGKLRALAVTSPRRSSVAPEIPTVAESGIPGYEVVTWYGLMVPTGTPREIIAQLHLAATNALEHPEVRKRFETTDLEPAGSTPEQFGAFVRSEVAKWAKVIRDSGMTAD